MAIQESFILDGLELNSTSTTLRVKAATLDPPAPRYLWASSVDTEGDALVFDPTHENRIIELTVQVAPQTTMDLALAQIVAVRDKLKKANATPGGIGLVWTPKTASTSCTFDVLAGEITGLPVNWTDGWFAKAPTMDIRLIAKPYWRSTTETLTSTATSGTTPVATLEIASVPGDVPALGRLIVTDSATQNRRHVEWGIEGPRTYNSGTGLLIDSDALVTSGFGGTQATTISGAYDVGGGNTQITATAYTGTTAICGTGNLSHVGTFRVKARIYAASTAGGIRFSWQANDGPFTANPWATPNTEAVASLTWQEVDLGLITIPAATVGTQRWQGRVEAYGTAAGIVYAVDYLVLVPASDGYGVASVSSVQDTSGVVVGTDTFIGTTAGNALNARAAPAGGTWATSGDATDFVFNDSLVSSGGSPLDAIETIIRSTNVVETTGRFAILGSTNYTDTQLDARVRMASAAQQAEQSLVARWTDASNHLRFTTPDVSSGRTTRLETVVAGVVTVLDQTAAVRVAANNYRMRLIVYASGRVTAQLMSDSGSVLTQLQATTTVLATAGTLATGKPGIRDLNFSAFGPEQRYVAEFTVATPTAEPYVIYSGRNMQIRYDTTVRQDSTGTYAGPPQSYEGSRFTVPVGTSRMLVKARRNNVDTSTDVPVTDNTTIQIGYTPRGLVVPR